MHRIAGIAIILLLSGCTSLGAGKVPSFSFFNTFASVQKDFERGQIMKARAKVLAMDKTREDYPQAQAFLKKRIEPARRRLLGHYRALAGKAEAKGEWFRAMQAYEQAASFSLKPASLLKKRQAMELKFRQVRLDALLRVRRQQDSEWLAHQDDFEPPKGVPARDEVFLRKREQFQNALEDRAELAYSEAKRFLRKGYPEIAYMEIESYLRLDPQSEAGRELKSEIGKVLPKGIVIAPLRSNEKMAATKRVVLPKRVTARQVEALLKKGKLVEARRYALVYRRAGGKGAAKLLKRVQDTIAAQAEAKFNQGTKFYRMEKLDRAIQLWSEAVALMPENIEYREALRRAQQLKERLKLLKEAAAESEAPASKDKGQ